MELPLYKRSHNNKILMWDITLDGNLIVIITGELLGQHKSYVSKTKYSNINTEIEHRIKEKLDDGWVKHSLHYDVMSKVELNDLLLKTLPNVIKDISGRRNPQKGVYYNKDYAEYPAAIQPKLNGVRCTLEWGIMKDGIGMFETTNEQAILKSREGVTYILPHITESLNKDFFIKEDNEGNEILVTYDGELYIPGKSLTYIRSSIPYLRKDNVYVSSSNNSSKVSFYCFDLAIENMIQIDRLIMKDTILKEIAPTDHSNTKLISPIVNVYTHIVKTESEAFSMRDLWLRRGYEGAMFRNFNYTYQFGKKNKCMLKLKIWMYTECEVLDIIEKRTSEISNNTRTYISFLLMNDINTNTFECTPDGDENLRIYLLNNKQKYIGTKVSVKYRERSETGNLPFQAVVETKKLK